MWKGGEFKLSKSHSKDHLSHGFRVSIMGTLKPGKSVFMLNQDPGRLVKEILCAFPES